MPQISSVRFPPSGLPTLHAGAASSFFSVCKVDLDEAVHGLYGTARAAMEALLKGRCNLAQSWNADARQLGERTVEWLRTQELPSGFGIAVAAFTLPLAALAVVGGVGEMKEGRDAFQRLRAEEDQLRHDAAVDGAVAMDGVDAKRDMGGGQAPSPAIMARCRDFRLAEIEREKAVAVANIQVGAASAGAGSLISVKAASEIVLQAALKILAKGAECAIWLTQSPAWSSAATIIGGVGAMVLAPLAALAALGLGSVFVHRSRVGRHAFMQARSHLLASLPEAASAAHLADNEDTGKPVGSPRQAEAQAAYVEFLRAKLDKRAGFMTRYRNWNIAFLSGAALYTLPTLAKAALIGAGLLGFAAIATNPVMLAAIIAITAVGAIGMAVSSYNFLFNHGRNKRHEGADPASDGLFLGPMMTLADSAKEAGHEGRGFLHRSEVYRAAQGMEDCVNALVDRIAAQAVGNETSGDAESVPLDKLARRAARRNRAKVRKSTLTAGLAQKSVANSIAYHEVMVRYLEIQCGAIQSSMALWAGLHGTDAMPPLLKDASGALHRLIRGLPRKATDAECAAAQAAMTRAADNMEAAERAEANARAAHLDAMRQWSRAQFSNAHTPDMVAIDATAAEDAGVAHARCKRDADVARQAYDELEATYLSAADNVGESIYRFLNVQATLGFAAPHDCDDDVFTAFADFLSNQAPAAFVAMRGNLVAAELQAARRAMLSPDLNTSANTPGDAI